MTKQNDLRAPSAHAREEIVLPRHIQSEINKSAHLYAQEAYAEVRHRMQVAARIALGTGADWKVAIFSERKGQNEHES